MDERKERLDEGKDREKDAEDPGGEPFSAGVGSLSLHYLIHLPCCPRLKTSVKLQSMPAECNPCPWTVSRPSAIC